MSKIKNCPLCQHVGTIKKSITKIRNRRNTQNNSKIKFNIFHDSEIALDQMCDISSVNFSYSGFINMGDGELLAGVIFSAGELPKSFANSVISRCEWFKSAIEFGAKITKTEHADRCHECRDRIKKLVLKKVRSRPART